MNNDFTAKTPMGLHLNRFQSGMREILDNAGMETYQTKSSGLLARHSGFEKIHCLEIGPYSLGGDGPILPRLKVNQNHCTSIFPRAVLRKWSLNPFGSNLIWFPPLELTFLPSEAAQVIRGVPCLLKRFEIENLDNWQGAFDFDTTYTISQNTWSTAANEVSNKWVRTSGALLRK